jgi:hypothetical protein
MNKAEALTLARSLLSDLEQPSMKFEVVVAKALRLAQLMGDYKRTEWLMYEMYGYQLNTDIGKKYAQIMGRWDGKSKTGTFAPAATLATIVDSMMHTIEAHKNYQPSGDFAHMHHIDRVDKLNTLISQITPIQNILSILRSQLHFFASGAANEAQFSETSRSIFESYQNEVDALLSSSAAEAFAKLPQVFERLTSGEQEAVSHALTSCRRIIDAFADAIYPPQENSVEVDGQALDCGKDKTRNRFRAYVAENTTSKSRKERINKSVVLLCDRVSAGVHSDVSPDEARALVLQTYLLLGELLSLRRLPE